MYIPGIHYVYRQNESDIGRGTESRGKCHLENETDFIEFACTYIYLYVYHTYGNSVTAATSIPGIKTMILFIIFSKHFFFPIPFVVFALLFSLPPSRNSDPGSHSRLFVPHTHCGSCLAFFIARRFQLFLPSSTRVELCLPTPGALSSSSFFCCK